MFYFYFFMVILLVHDTQYMHVAMNVPDRPVRTTDRPSHVSTSALVGGLVAAVVTGLGLSKKPHGNAVTAPGLSCTWAVRLQQTVNRGAARTLTAAGASCVFSLRY